MATAIFWGLKALAFFMGPIGRWVVLGVGAFWLGNTLITKYDNSVVRDAVAEAQTADELATQRAERTARRLAPLPNNKGDLAELCASDPACSM